jgi:hypothetical protein
MKSSNLYPYISQVVKEKLEYADCDGCTRCIAYLLKIANVKFRIWRGEISTKEFPDAKFPIHYWLEDEQGKIWDFKSFKWLGKESEDCIYYKERDITGEFLHDNSVFNVMIEMSNIVGKEQDTLWEKQTGLRFHRLGHKGEEIKEEKANE